MPYSPDSVYRVEIHATAENQAIINTYDYRTTLANAAFDEAAMTDLMETVWGSFETQIVPLLSEEWRLQKLVCREIVEAAAVAVPKPHIALEFDAQVQRVETTTIEGAKAGDYLPTYASVGVYKPTASPTRNYRGGNRYGPIAEADTIGNKLTDAVFAAWVAAMPAVFLELAVQNSGAANIFMEQVVYSGTLHANDALNLPARNFTRKVTAHVPRQFLGTQKTRQHRLS